ncbi:MAG: MFS transporter [Cyanobacteriota bacterium]|nr:MFS transporter [Cyanobacteriota bacterium]
MTPMVFHAIDFSASQVGSGLALSALVGTVVRLLSGALLDRGLSCSWPIRFTTILAVLADITLFRADSYGGFVVGEILLGSAAGLYWPAIELAVPLSCGAVPSGRGYALVRSSDALGFGIGALIGSLCAWLGTLRLIYGVEAICMIAVLVLISLYPLLDERSSTAEARQRQTPEPRLKPTWLLPLLPVLAISIMATGILSLEQSALPIDLVRGGLERPGLSETSSGGLIALQLSLLVILQWPVGRWLAERSVGFGLGLSLSSFSLACLLLGVSALTSSGTTLVVLALLPMALAQAAFLPTATEAVIEETPPQHRGLAMALFSQCFAISAVVAPLLGGALLDQQGHGLLLWLGMAVACLAMLPTAYQLRPRFDSSGSRDHLVDAVAGNPGPLGG